MISVPMKDNHDMSDMIMHAMEEEGEDRKMTISNNNKASSILCPSQGSSPLCPSAPCITISSNGGNPCSATDVPTAIIPTAIPSLGNPTLFFDLDNTLYPESNGITKLMVQRIHLYCTEKLGLSAEKAEELGRKYFQDYGVAVRGLLIHYNIDPVDYDHFVDGGLPLENILKPDPKLAFILEQLEPYDKWVFTNAGLPHAKRVLSLLGISDHFKGIVYCDYSEKNFVCKPEAASYIKAMKCAGIQNSSQCVFIDDSLSNIQAALRMGWKAIHVKEFDHGGSFIHMGGNDAVMNNNKNIPSSSYPVIRNIHEVLSVIHEILKVFFKSEY